MAKNEKTTEQPAKTRTIRTPEQQLADAEAKLAALRAKVEAKANKELNSLLEKKGKLEVKIADLKEQHAKLEVEISKLDVTSPEQPAELNEG